ncbi:hypothetical protein Back2_26360 [Nocardioides baekrokdamisoli]|uniref:Uncharacterized protein n=1 Tax=Nocardioides baekrokdamisoli TaxID=1804624 RepID=A0A3G9J5R8_9ACTN|nr:hypothetical protein [Nocardioides baekrokdamisoli]BBH18349.1 hypothetical protein Back2_26360 [Nocardioides baekrokdamisoli]
MSMLQVKNLPAELHEKLAERARSEHTTMSALVIAMLDRELNEHPTTAWIAKVRARTDNLPSIPREAIDRALAEAKADLFHDERFDGPRP